MSPPPIPSDLVIYILSFLHFKDLTICSGVCRQFQEIIDTTASLEYVLELGLSGLADLNVYGFVKADVLRYLREREHAWSALQWRMTRNIPVGKKYAVWELCGSIFLGAYLREAAIPHPGTAFDAIDIFNLNDVDSGGCENGGLPLERSYYNLATDPGQDLLILVESLEPLASSWTVHIQNLSGQVYHPRAKQPIIRVSVAYRAWVAPSGFPGAVDIQILGCVALFSQHRGVGGSGSITVFDWTTGVSYPSLGDWCCALLSENDLIVAARSPTHRQPVLEYYQINRDSKWKARRVPFQLPFHGSNTMWRPVYCYNSASFTNTSEALVRSGIWPLAYPPEPQLLAFRFVDNSSTSASRSNKLDMFLKVEHLHSYTSYGDTVPWETWGPHSTRFFRDILPNNWQRSIRGYRVVLPNSNIILDFNGNLWSADDPFVIAQPSQISFRSSGGFTITSSLPYRELRSLRSFKCSNTMLGDNIVCADTDPNDIGTLRSLRVLSL
ncbi:hypothetical protein BU17DRAFT_82618 [Hysterangium stoloniferum]|nr:hypothetical protein BU17DRAFT_82618 [Hysterangium stoloniferum]